TPDEVGDAHALKMKLDVNGEVRQNGTTADMIFKIPFLLSYVSQFMVLEPGDVVTTGTPAGVALGMKEPKWLKAGDVVTLSIDKLGSA
ncbi:fumarylacetoacetate hydrolase family protein, partial [Acinetobacter baumannii]